MIERQHHSGLGHVGFIEPAVVVHRLGQPLVAVVLEEVVDQGHHGVDRHKAPLCGHRLEPHDERRGVDRAVGVAAVLVGEAQRREQLHRRGRQVVEARVAEHPLVWEPAVPQDRAHLDRVRRAEGAGDLDRVARFFWHCRVILRSVAPSSNTSGGRQVSIHPPTLWATSIDSHSGATRHVKTTIKDET